jgi:hypothetical protein
MTWDRSVAAPALAQALTDAATASGELATAFANPPTTLNPPALVVAYPISVRFAATAFSIDEVQLPVICFGQIDGPDVVSRLVTFCREAVFDTQLGGAVQTCYATEERNWRPVNVAGTDLLTAEVVFTIQM